MPYNQVSADDPLTTFRRDAGRICQTLDRLELNIPVVEHRWNPRTHAGTVIIQIDVPQTVGAGVCAGWIERALKPFSVTHRAAISVSRTSSSRGRITARVTLPY